MVGAGPWNACDFQPESNHLMKISSLSSTVAVAGRVDPAWWSGHPVDSGWDERGLKEPPGDEIVAISVLYVTIASCHLGH